MRLNEAQQHAQRLLARTTEIRALSHGTFVLSSGEISDIYFDGRRATTDPECVYIISEIFINILRMNGINCFGGPAIGAVPLLGSMALRSYQLGYSLKCFYVREERKRHGKGNLIEGCVIDAYDRVAVWDDTVRTGRSLEKAVLSIKEFTDEIPFAMSVMDRSDGSFQSPIFSILTIDEGRAVVNREMISRWF